MSIMTCDRCDRYIDTDWDVEGLVTPDGQFVCSFCVEDDMDRAEEAVAIERGAAYWPRLP